MLPRPCTELLRQARRASRRADEAEDLLQTVLVAAVEAGRTDLNKPENRRWLEGALRHGAAFDARTAIRRRRREQPFAVSTCEAADRQGLPHRFVYELPGGWSADIADPDGHTISMYQSAEAPRSLRKVA
ncbi:hypothetical protein [Aminobacter sp. BE322]|uniref:hypothetical protein n=1 Tax=unclassified Aminobacter TaxID=2644704 RepID=UPI003D194C1E